MAIYRDPYLWAASVDARLKKWHRRVKVLHREMAEDVSEHVDPLLSGGVKTKTLRALGYPYAKDFKRLAQPVEFEIGGVRATKFMNVSRRGISRARRKKVGFKGSAPLLPINEQTGRLKRGKRLVRVGGYSQAFDLKFVGVSYSPFILSKHGTRKMVGRKFREEMERYEGQRRRLFLARAQGDWKRIFGSTISIGSIGSQSVGIKV